MNSAKRRSPISRHSILLWTGVLLVLALEARFDIFEKGVGFYMWVINPLRPQVGRLWTEEEKDQAGAQQISSIVDNLKPDSSITTTIRDLEDLKALLSIRESITISQEEFLRFYRMLPIDQARKIIDPLLLLDLYRAGNWQSVRLFPAGEQIGIHFLDGSGQMLIESYLDAAVTPGPTEIAGTSGQLDGDPRFKGRIVNAEDFYNAFDKLSQSYRLQIINDPYKLIQWGANLKRVGIAPVVEDGIVTIAFEIKSDDRLKIFEIQASEIAAGYLIAEINALGTMPPLKLPENKEAPRE